MTRNGHKFNAVRTEIDGIKFASKAEAKRFVELRILERAGHISHLALQPRYELSVAGVKLGVYVGDFVYFDKDLRRSVCEDVKGFKTALYRWKKKHVEAQYGISITEITR